MEDELKSKIQQRISSLEGYWFDNLHRADDLPSSFRPWDEKECGLSPSSLYNCSLKCRKESRIKTPETKWMSIKRWVTVTNEGIKLPPGVYFSVKRSEQFEALPQPRLNKTEYVILMFPFGNVWSQVRPGMPIDEEWLWTELEGMTMFERLYMKDAAHPLSGYFRRVYDFMKEHPDQIGIHLKRKKKEAPAAG